MTRTGQRGFTLLELIVAAGILALIAVFSWRGLDALIREREAIAASQAVIDVMQRSFARLERDAQIASDVQLDGAGTMRLVTAATGGAGGATVEYRLAAGTLTRTVVGVDRAPLQMMDGLSSLTMEAWSPGLRGGGSWVTTRGMAVEAPRAVPAARAGAVSTNDAIVSPPIPGTILSQQQAAANGPSSPNVAGANAPSVAAATGVRISLARADGAVIVRAFMVGGG